MRKSSYVAVTCMVMILTGLLGTRNALAETAKPMTALEKKLYEAARTEGMLNWWDTHSLKEAALFIKTFSDRYPGIKVSYWEANVPRAEERYFAERQAGRRTLDVTQIDSYRRFKGEGLLTDLSDIVKDAGFPKELCTRDFDAASLEHTVKGVSYNTKLISPKDVPRSLDELLDPKWKGKIAVESKLDIFVFLTQSWGEEKMIAYLKKLREQKIAFTNGVTQTTTFLGAGEFAIAVNNSLHKILDMQAKALPVAFAPISPVVDKFAPSVAVRDAPHPNAAKLFMRWLISAEGQSMTEKIKQKGNPMPGSGTAQSKAIEQLGIKVVAIPVWEIDYDRIQERYAKAIGFTQ